MTERPILFSGPMVRAILSGKKTMTRRVLKTQPLDVIPGVKPGEWVGLMERDPARGVIFGCKYGRVGDRLWVKESWWAWGHFEPTGRLTETGKPEMEFVWDGDRETMAYLDDYPNGPDYKPFRMSPDKRDKWHRRPSIFMPRWASRLNLEITGVKVERAQEISGADAVAEGVTVYSGDDLKRYDNAIGGARVASVGIEQAAVKLFAELWDSINGARPGCSWQDNPWVWAIGFKQV